MAGVSLSLFIYWGWDVSLTVNEEADDASSTPGRAAVLTVMTIVSVYMFVTVGSMMFAGLGKERDRAWAIPRSRTMSSSPWPDRFWGRLRSSCRRRC